ncbi:MAG TPA: hypothetical protein VGF58_06560 [Burkholderiales bacterium]
MVPMLAMGADAPAVVTLVEGPAALLRTTGRFALAEGVRVHVGDIVDVPDKGLVQIAFADGARVSLGPRSRFHVAALAGAAGRGGHAAAVSDFYLLQGWSKLALPPKAAPLRVTTPLFGLGSADAVVVLHVESAEASLFVESGGLRLAEGFVRATPASAVAVAAGQFYVRRADQKGVLQPRPAPSFVAAMPASYRDNLPQRLAAFKDREVSPRRLGDLTYEEVEPWLKGPPELRRPLMQRMRARAQDPEFRKALIANMRFHPEWDRILFPEKYLPKPTPSVDPAKAPPTTVDSAKAPPTAAGATPARPKE